MKAYFPLLEIKKLVFIFAGTEKKKEAAEDDSFIREI